MDYENAGIRHIEIRKKDHLYDEFDTMVGIECNKYAEKDDENYSSDSSDDETFCVSPELSSSTDFSDKDEMNLASLLNVVDEIDDNQIKGMDKKYIHDKKRMHFMETNFNLNTKVSYPKGRPSSSFVGNNISTDRIISSNLRPISAPVGRPKNSTNKLNISFSNDKVRKIDMENQRLLQKIVQQKTKTNSTKSHLPPKKVMSAAAINRSRQQQSIEQENFRFLKRLQAVKPTSTLSKNNLLKEHIKNEKHVGRLSRTGRPVSAPVRRSQYNLH